MLFLVKLDLFRSYFTNVLINVDAQEVEKKRVSVSNKYFGKAILSVFAFYELYVLAIEAVSKICGCKFLTVAESAAAIAKCRERFETVPYNDNVAATPNPII